MLSRANARWALRRSVFLLVLASACSDSGLQRSAPMDAGEMSDASPRADAAEDVGPGPADDAGPPVPMVVCGDRLCAPHQASLVERVVAAGCALDHQGAEVCGLASPDAGATFDGGVPAFLPKDAPGMASPSCGAFLESQIEPPQDAAVDGGDAGYANAQLDVRVTILPDGLPLEIIRVYPGCCTPLGSCGVDSRNGLAIQAYGRLSYNAGYGCVDPRAFLTAYAPALRTMRCDPQSGLIDAQPDASTDAGRDGGPSDAGADADAGNG